MANAHINIIMEPYMKQLIILLSIHLILFIYYERERDFSPLPGKKALYVKKENGALAEPQNSLNLTKPSFSYKNAARSNVYPTATAISSVLNGFRQGSTKGSIKEASHTLILEKAAGYEVDDYVIIELGGEKGKGKRGTMGVGGSWPQKMYPSPAAMYKDKSLPDQTYAWVENTGEVFRWDKGKLSWHRFNKNYYLGEKAIPIALRARVTAVSANGRLLTLDKAAVTTSTNAETYFDNAILLNKLSVYYDEEGNGKTKGHPAFKLPVIKLPPGKFAIGESIIWLYHKNIIVQGAGKKATILFSPKGTPSASMQFRECINPVAKDFELRGNAKAEGFGFTWWDLRNYMRNEIPSQFDYVGTELVRNRGGIQFLNCENGIGINLKVTDPFTYGLQAGVSKNTWFYNCEVELTEGNFAYLGWLVHFYQSTGGGVKNCTVKSPFLTSGFEAFLSTGVQFIRPVSINGVIAQNNSGDFLLDHPVITITAKSLPQNNWFSVDAAVIDINGAMGTSFTHLGGKIINPSIKIEGYIDHYNNVLNGLAIREEAPYIKVNGGSYTAPHFKKSAGNKYKGQGVLIEGEGCVVDGFKVSGNLEENNPNHPISVYYSHIGANVRKGKPAVIKNCIARHIRTTSNVLTQNNKYTGN